MGLGVCWDLGLPPRRVFGCLALGSGRSDFYSLSNSFAAVGCTLARPRLSVVRVPSEQAGWLQGGFAARGEPRAPAVSC